MDNGQLIAGWQVKLLGDIYDVRDGTHDSPKFVDNGYPLITSKNLKNGGLNFDKVKNISIEDYTKINARSAVHQGDVLFAMIGTIGNPVVVEINPNFAIKNVALFKVPVDQSSYFLKYYLESEFVKKKMFSEAKGTTQKFVGLGYLRKFPVPLPLLPEQKRIVAILNEAFAGINLAVANAEKNLANARELFESYLNNVFTQKGDGWEEKQLSDFTISVTTGPFGSLLHKSDYVTEGVPLVNPINIVNGEIVPDSSKLIGNSTKERLSSYILNVGDIVVGRRGEIGRCAVVDSEQDGWICGTGCFVIRPLADVNPEFLAHLLRSQTYRDNLESVATGATMKNISNKALSNLIVCIPSFKAQVSILNQISFLEQKIFILETIYKQKLTALNELKQSILQKAFTGELTQREENV